VPPTVLVPIQMTPEMWERVRESADASRVGSVDADDKAYNAKLVDDAENFRLTRAVRMEVCDLVYLALFGASPQPGAKI